MKRLTKRLAQLEAKLRFMASQKSFSKSKMFGVVQQILAVEAAIAGLSNPKTDLEIAQEIAANYDGNVWSKAEKTRVYFKIEGFRKKFYIEVKNGNLDMTNAPVKVAFAIRNAA